MTLIWAGFQKDFPYCAAKDIELLLFNSITSFSRLKHFIRKVSMTSFFGIIAAISELCHKLCPGDSVIQLVRQGQRSSTDCSQRTEMKIVSNN